MWHIWPKWKHYIQLGFCMPLRVCVCDSVSVWWPMNVCGIYSANLKLKNPFGQQCEQCQWPRATRVYLSRCVCECVCVCLCEWRGWALTPPPPLSTSVWLVCVCVTMANSQMQTIYHTLNNSCITDQVAFSFRVPRVGRPFSHTHYYTNTMKSTRSECNFNYVTHTHKQRESSENAEWHSIKHISTPINGQKGSQRETDNDNEPKWKTNSEKQKTKKFKKKT